MSAFADRVDAGKRLVLPLAHLGIEDPVVLALPRGGVPVAFEIASSLHAPLDVLVARKLGAPQQPELGIGAIAEGGATYLDAEIIWQLGVTPYEISRAQAVELPELERRVQLYRGHRPPIDVRGRTVILVDDGLATGVTARAALQSLRARGPARIVFATPVCSPSAAREIRAEIDELVCAAEPSAFHAVGLSYTDFTQTTDTEVLALLDRARRGERSARPSEPRLARTASESTVTIAAAGVELLATLSIPADASAVVLFAHGSGSNRGSPRNRYVAGELHRSGIATLLLDLLSADEEVEDEQTLAFRFDIPLLARRVFEATSWLRAELPDLEVGYFGASTGAAAAIVAATQRPDVRAIATRGGRVDLAGSALGALRTPTLMVVGGRDHELLRTSREAAAQMNGFARLVLVPGATRLFEEPGALTHVARFAQRWFVGHIGALARFRRKESA